MPIKHVFVLKTIVRASNSVTVPDEITNDLLNLKKNAFSSSSESDAGFTIFVQKVDGVMFDSGIEIDGKLSDLEAAAAKNIHELSLEAVKGNGGDNGKIKTVFVLKM